MALFSLAAFCADGLRGPVTGLVLDQGAGAIRRVDGMVGAAVLSEPIQIDVRAEAAVFDRALRFALVTDAAGDVFLVTDPAGATPAAIRVAGAMSGVTAMALDASGAGAVLYAAEGHRVQLVKGLPGEPQIFLTAEVPELGGDVTALAALPAEAGALIAAGGEEQSRIFRLGSDGGLKSMAGTGLVRSMAVTGPEAFVYADSTRNELVQVRGRGEGAEMTILAGPSDLVDDPTALCALDGGGFSLANAGSKTLLTFDANGVRAAGAVPLHFAPTRCLALGGGQLLQLNDAGKGPLYLLEYSDSPKLMFVPPAQAEEVQQ